jgi:hypothetical protein
MYEQCEYCLHKDLVAQAGLAVSMAVIMVHWHSVASLLRIHVNDSAVHLIGNTAVCCIHHISFDWSKNTKDS